MSLKIEDIRFASSSIDAFFEPAPAPRQASVGKRRIASLHDLAGFARVGTDTLVHLSQQDFWHIGKDDQGFFIERLVDDSEGPVEG